MNLQLDTYFAHTVIALIIFYIGIYIYQSRETRFDKFVDKYSSLFPSIRKPIFLSFYRISHSLVSIFIALQLFELIPYTFYKDSKSNFIEFKLLHSIWIIASLLILLGTRFRFVYILNFVISYILLGTNIGDVMLKIASFWMVFILPAGDLTLRSDKLRALGLDRNPTSYNSDWAVYLMGFNLAFIITISGIFKALDPAWLHGLGFYYAYIQPWIHVGWTHFILDYEWLMLVMNYLGILFESTALLLYMNRKTRFLSLFVMTCFLGLVNFPLRIDPVGPAGVVMLIALLSFFPSTKKQRQHTKACSENIINTRTQNGMLLLCTILMTLQVSVGLKNNWKRFKYPLVEWPFIDNSKEYKQWIPPTRVHLWAKNSMDILFNKLYQISLLDHWRIVHLPSIFSFNHSCARGYYRIFTDGIAGEKEFIKVFRNDAKVAKHGDRSGFLKPLNLHVVYGRLGIIYYKVCKSRSFELLDETEIVTLKSLFSFSCHRYEEKTGQKATTSKIFINPIQVPIKYVGRFNGSPKQWQLVLSLNHHTNNMSIVRASKYETNFNKIEIPGLKNRKFVFFLDS